MLARPQSQPHWFAYGYAPQCTPGELPTAWTWLADIAQILSRPGKLVLDRSFVSELVYGPLQHGRSRISIAEAASLASIIAEREGVLVHLTGHARGNRRSSAGA